jgi:hypothetical protein
VNKATAIYSVLHLCYQERAAMPELRNLVVTIIADKRTHTSAGNFPQNCPNCRRPWSVHEAWIDNGPYKSGGRQAECEHCTCQTFEVIDREKSTPGFKFNSFLSTLLMLAVVFEIVAFFDSRMTPKNCSAPLRGT